jgi:glutamate 5-kinase
MSARLLLRQRARTGHVVVKIGSGVLTDDAGRLDPKIIRRLAKEIAPLVSAGRFPTIVSSGAIAVGVHVLGLKSRPKTMPGLQAAAAVGQSKLMEAWSRAFARHELHVAQVLLTHDDLGDRRRFLNVRRALGELEKRKAIAIINENDTVSFEEIALGDNDKLAAQVANLVDAGLLILMSVAPGLQDDRGLVVPECLAADRALDRFVTQARSKTGVGGMGSKLEAARAAAARGAMVVIVDGKTPGRIAEIIEGEPVGTLLLPSERTQLQSREHWILHTLRPRGRLVVDEGARKALVDHNKSLLPSGVRRVEGRFQEGDPVDIALENEAGGLVFARGLARYGAPDMERIAGQKSERIAEILGQSAGDAAVHRDDLVLIDA